MKKIFFVTIVIIFFSAYALSISSPQIIAHRGGNQNWPENTLCAFRQNLKQGVAAIELDVQVTKDNIVVVYHPDDLFQWTQMRGPISQKNSIEVLKLDASIKYGGPNSFKTVCTTSDDLRIPKFIDVLKEINSIPIIVDLKSLPAKKIVNALIRIIPESQWPRLRFYSTSQEHTDLIKKLKPTAIVFEDRNITFERLITVASSHQCTIKRNQSWVGYELIRNLRICDETKLNNICLEKLPFEMWTPQSIQCTRDMTDAKLVLFGINTKKAYRRATHLGADAILTDNPEVLLQ